MGIKARIETERSERIVELLDPHNRTNWLLYLAVLDSTACLRFIDPYGNTLFNGLQLPVLQKELSELTPQMTEANLSESKRVYLERAAVLPRAAIEEARTALEGLSIDDLRQHLAQLSDLVSHAMTKGPHHYIRFVGD